MKTPIVFLLAGGLSAFVGFIFMFLMRDSFVPWLLDGYLFICFLWIALRVVKYRPLSSLGNGRRFAQVLISLVWWPLALGGGMIGLFATKDLSASSFLHSFIMYGSAAAVAVCLGTTSVVLRGLQIPYFLTCATFAANLMLITGGLVLYKQFQASPFILSNHYEAWLSLTLFVPLASLNAWVYGLAVLNGTKAGWGASL